MSKICSNCGNYADDSSKFCQLCGGNNFYQQNDTSSENEPISQNVLQTENSTSNQYSYSGQNYNSNQFYNGNQQSNMQYQNANYSYINQPYPNVQPIAPKKKLSTGKIVTIVIASLLVIVFVFSVVINYLSDGYTKGEIVDGYYVNEWADIKFEITDNMKPLSDEEKNKKFSFSKGEECGFASFDTTTNEAIMIDFQYITVVNDKTEDELLDQFFDQINMNDYILNSERDYIDISGHQYRLMKVDFSGLYNVYVCVMMKDNYAVIILAQSSNIDFITDFLNSITTAK